MLLTNKELLASAVTGKYAVGAFNIHNLESLQAVVTAAQEAWKRLRFIITSEEEQSVMKDCDRK